MHRVAVVQMLSSANVQKNLEQLKPLFAQAQTSGASLILLPENVAFMGCHETDKFQIAETLGCGLIQDTLARLAKQYGIWTIAGTIPIKATNNRVKACSIVYDDQGIQVARYDKIHLFDVQVSATESHRESATIERGNQLVVVDTPVGRVGLSVCYDVRFPELYRRLVLQNAELFAIPSAFTAVTGLAHWDILLKARAIENLCYVLGANQGGVHENGRSTYGHSMIIDPWGRVLSELAEGVGVIVADIDLNQLKQLRQQFPCNDHHIL